MKPTYARTSAARSRRQAIRRVSPAIATLALASHHLGRDHGDRSTHWRRTRHLRRNLQHASGSSILEGDGGDECSTELTR
jgi:hypothetical protein